MISRIDSAEVAERIFDIARAEASSTDLVQSVALPLAIVLALRVGDQKSARLPYVRARGWPQPVAWEAISDALLRGEFALSALPELACASAGLDQRLSRGITLHDTSVLRELVRWIDSLPASTADAVSSLEGVLRDIVASAARRSRFGPEFTTPPSLARLMVSLAHVRPGQRVYDPCCGAGELLVAAAHAQTARGAPERSITERPLHVGVERASALAFIAGLRLVLAGGWPDVEAGDALLEPTALRHQHEGYDVVLVDPPWGIRLDDPGHISLPLSTKNAESKFIQHGLESLRTSGTAVFAVPAGVLFREGAERELRRVLIERFGLSVVALITPGRRGDTSLPTALIVARRRRRAGRILFINVKSSSGADEVVERIVAAVEEGALGAEPAHVANDGAITARSVSQEEVAAGDFDLNVSRYTDPYPADVLKELSKQVEMRPLARVATIVAGASLTSAAMTVTANDGRPIIRVSDVNPKGPLVLGARFLETKAAVKVREDQSLRAGDLLLTIDGTIGKTHVVETVILGGRIRDAEAEPRPLIAKGVVAIRVESPDVDPGFLHGVLSSEAFQAYMRRASKGVGIPHLSLRELRDLRVPVPSTPIQARVARRLAEQGGDAIEVLGLVLTDRDGDRLAELFREHLAFQRLAGEGEPEQQELERLSFEVLDVLRRLRNETVHPADAKVHVAPQFLPWLLRVGALPTGVLRPALSGAARYEAFAASAALLDAAAAALKNTAGLVAYKASRLTERLAQWARTAQERLANDFVLEARQVPGSLSADQPFLEIEIMLRGQGALHHVRFIPPPGWELVAASQQARLPLGPSESVGDGLAAGRRSRVQLRRVVQDHALHPQVLRILWEATRLDGSVVTGEVLCDVAPAQLTLFEPQQVLGASPYITGAVVEDPAMFFGRARVLQDLRSHIGGGTKVILLEGNRRTGKTSILRRIQAPDFGLVRDWILVECSFQGAVGDEKKDGVPTRDLFRLIVRDIGLASSKSGVPVPLPGMGPTSSTLEFKFSFLRALNPYFEGIDPYEALLLYVDLVVESIAPKRLLLMFDEFDKLQVGIDNGVTSPQVPENIRNLLQTRSQIGAIITGSRRLKRLREAYWSALFGFGHRIGIDPLQSDEASDLIARPVQGRLSFSTAAIDLIIQLTASQPFLIQSLCARIFELAKQDQYRRVEQEHVAEAALRMVHDNEHFQALWSYAETERRRFILCLCSELEGGDTRVSADLLAERLEKAGLRVSVDAIDDDLKMLLELEIVRLTNTETGPQYGLTVPLMNLWMHQAVDGEAQRRRAIQEARARSGR